MTDRGGAPGGRPGPGGSEAEVRRAICAAGALLHERGLLAGAAGNLSARLEDGRVVVTPRGVRKDRMRPDDLIVLDPSSATDPDPDAVARATTEWPLHRACHAARRAAGAVVHAHAPALTALGLGDDDGAERLLRALPELEDAVGRIATLPFAPSGSEELATSAADALERGVSVLVLARHGVVATGSDTWAAVDRMELAELSARALLMAR